MRAIRVSVLCIKDWQCVMLVAHPGVTACQTASLAANSPHRTVLLLLLTAVMCGLHMGHPFSQLQRAFG